MSLDANLGLLTHVTAALAVILGCSRLFGVLATRIGQPRVVGEMISGVLLGPTLLGAVAPAVTTYLFDAKTKPVLYVLGMVGLTFYMFLVGLEHHRPPSSSGRVTLPIVLGIAGVVGPLVAGGAAAYLIADRHRPADVPIPIFVLFCGGALAVTAFPMLARILQERGMVATTFGSVAVTVAAIDDALAWCLLALVTSLVVNGTASAVLLTLVPAASMAGTLTVAARHLNQWMAQVVRAGRFSDGTFAATAAGVLVIGWFSDSIGIYSVFGGFILGASLPRVSGFARLAEDTFGSWVRCLLLPVFFAFSGLNTDLTELVRTQEWATFALMLAVAVGAKALVGYAVLRTFRWGHGEAMSMGALMNARGLMILIFVNAGLSMHVISRPLFSIFVAVAIITTALALPIYRRHFTPAREEAARRDALAGTLGSHRIDRPATNPTPAPGWASSNDTPSALELTGQGLTHA